MNRRTLLLGGGAAVAGGLIMPPRLLARAPQVTSSGPGFVPRPEVIAYAEKTGLTRAEVAYLRGITRWEAKLPPKYRGQGLVTRVASRMGAKFVAGRTAAMMVAPYIPVAGWIVGAGLLAWTAYDIYRASEDLDAPGALKVRPQTGAPPIQGPTTGGPYSTTGAVRPWENAVSQRVSGFSYWWDLFNSTQFGAVYNAPGLANRTLAWAFIPANPQIYHEANYPATPTSRPFLTPIEPLKYSLSGLASYVCKAQFIKEDRTSSINTTRGHPDIKHVIVTNVYAGNQYQPIIPTKEEWAARPVDEMGLGMPNETLINPNLVAATGNEALAQERAANPDTTPDPAQYPMTGTDFDVAVHSEDLAETLAEGRPRAMNPEDPAVSRATGEMTAPAEAADPTGNPNPKPAPWPGTAPGTGTGTGTETEAPPADPTFTEDEVSAGIAGMTRASKYSYTLTPGTCPPIMLGQRRIDQHCPILNYGGPKIREITGYLAPVAALYVLLGRG